MPEFRYSLFADYHQFYLQDEASDGVLPEAWTDDAVHRMLASSPGAIGVGTARNTNVPVTVEILGGEPAQDIGGWDHVAECTLDVSSGTIVVAGCTDFFPDAARINVPSGTYRARVSIRGLDTLSDNGLEDNDTYRVQLWKASTIEPHVIKYRAG